MLVHGSIYSQALQMETAVSFLTPADYADGRPWRVAYLLHGLMGRSDDYINYTMLPDYCRGSHCLFVLPDAQRSFYADMACGGAYFTYLTRELPQTVANLFRVSAQRQDTVILGASMGGYGALKAALTLPLQYGACAAFSAACLDLRAYLRPEWLSGQQPDAFRRIYGDGLRTDFQAAFGTPPQWKRENDLSALAAEVPPENRPRMYACCGSRDLFLSSNRTFYQSLEDGGWSPVYEEWAGEHNWTFFNEGLRRGLAFCLGK